MKYYTLLEKHAGAWAVAFGDYDREVVADERADLIDGGQRAKDLKVITTNEDAASINAAIARLNGAPLVSFTHRIN